MADGGTAASGGDGPLLTVDDLAVRFPTDDGLVRAVDGVSFRVRAGETVCIVGESGSGKTVTGEAITRLVDAPPAEIDGSVRFRGTELTTASDRRLRAIRGDAIAHVFQNPEDALNPVTTAGRQIVEAIRLHRDVTRRAARERAIDLLDRVGIPAPAERVDAYPHELSGGQRQRVVIACALAADPDLLIADEPTTALDVTIQAQVLDLFRDLQRETGLALLFVTHDLGVVAQLADRVVVLYAGKVMEHAPVERLFDAPSHPYTRALLRCLPGRGRVTAAIDGRLPDPTDPPSGCRFHPRCPHAVEECRRGDQPPLHAVPVATDGEGNERATDDGTDSVGTTASCVFYGPGRDPATLGSFDPDAPTAGEGAGQSAGNRSSSEPADGGMGGGGADG